MKTTNEYLETLTNEHLERKHYDFDENELPFKGVFVPYQDLPDDIKTKLKNSKIKHYKVLDDSQSYRSHVVYIHTMYLSTTAVINGIKCKVEYYIDDECYDYAEKESEISTKQEMIDRAYKIFKKDGFTHEVLLTK